MMKKSYSIITSKSRTINAALRTDLRSSIKLERFLERKSLSLKAKLVEDRGRTLAALALRSRQQEKDKKGGIGGALSLLGGGLFGRGLRGKGRIPKVPKLPTRGGAFLSRVGKVGKLGKVGPLAVLGTGLDFAGRKAEGQTNLQAGIGAGGGLAGALAGAKYGAILGTAVGGPVGTLIGGVGGSIIGGLAGGRLADLFTGAEKRRKFEEKRVELDTQRSLFSFALDDLDRVLDKLENISLLSIKGTRGDDEVPETPDFVGFFTRPKPFYQRPAVQITSLALLLAGALVLGGPTGEEIPIGTGLLAAMQKTKLGAFIIKKSPFLTKLLKKSLPVADDAAKVADDFLIPGKDIPGISAKGLRIRAQALLKKINPNIKFDNVKPPKTDKLETLLKKQKQLEDVLFNLMKNASPEKVQEMLQFYIKKGKFPKNIQRIIEGGGKTIKKKGGDIKVNPGRKFESGSFDMQNPKVNKVSGDSTTTLSFDSESTTGSDNIALAPVNNIFIINQGEGSSTNNTSMPQGGSTIVIGGDDSNPVDAAYKYAEMTALAATV